MSKSGDRYPDTKVTEVTIDSAMDHFLNLRLPSDPRISPDGRTVAYVLHEWVSDEPLQRSRIWLVENTAGEPYPLTTGARNDAEPCWSPDSKTLAFTSQVDNVDQHSQLYLANRLGAEEVRRLCATPHNISAVSWSPDGSRVAFLSADGVAAEGDPKVNEEERHSRLWTLSLESTTPEPVSPPNVTIWQYAWSPDSRHIAVYYSMGPHESDWYRGQIGVVAASGGPLRQISNLTRQAGAITWSRDGQSIYYVSDAWSDRPLVGGDVFEQALSGGEPQSLTPAVESSISWLSELPDGKRLLYVSWAGLSNQLGVLDKASNTTTVLSDDFYIGDRAWPRVSASPDLDAFVTTHGDQQHSEDLWLGSLSSDDAVREQVRWSRLSHLNPDLDTATIPSTSRLQFQGADGWRIEGLFTPPLYPQDRQLPPLVLNVHGGPTTAFRDTWLDATTVALSLAGYAVLRINPRGSMGRGTAFADAVLGDMGGKDFEDLMRGVDSVIERGLVDQTRMAITGWSYGGFMVAWAVGHTPRFKAAMMGAGICDFHGFHAQTNIANWDRDYIGADWLENPSAYRERSALTYATSVTTPTLIVHGEQDRSVPVSQSYAFYRALCERGVPAELAVYPREGHRFRERQHSRDLLHRLLRWLERYV
jgi:dipeptidyl aminopeptidase/acylaminoacyl peptidase